MSRRISNLWIRLSMISELFLRMLAATPVTNLIRCNMEKMPTIGSRFQRSAQEHEKSELRMTAMHFA